MKLNDLIDALASEVELAAPQLEQSLHELTQLDETDDAFLDALEVYSGQAQRMGEAAGMAGFLGLQTVCEHVVNNSLLLATLPRDERGATLIFLQTWPSLIVYYLRHLSDPSCAAGLIDHMRGAPMPMEEEDALKAIHQLGAMPSQMLIPDGNDAFAQRPVLSTPADVALDMPGDVDDKLVEGFFHEAPGQARTLVDLIRKLIAGQGQPDDLTAAKRVAHTLKGSGAIIGLRGLTMLGHQFEDILEYFEREGGRVADSAADTLLDAAYCLEQMVAYLAGTDDYPLQAQNVLQDVLDLANRIDRGESIEQRRPRAAAVAVAAHDLTEADAAAGSVDAAIWVQPTAELAAADVDAHNARFAVPQRNDERAVEAQGVHPLQGVIATPAIEMHSASPFQQPAPLQFTTLPVRSAVRRASVVAQPDATLSPTAALRVGVQSVDELFRVSGEVSVHSAAMEASIKALTERARELLAQNLRVQKRLFELETAVDVRALTLMRARSHGPQNASFDPLEMDQYSELHSTAHALIEEAADARTLASRLEDGIAQLTTVQTRQQRLSKDLQHLVIGIRMTEAGALESRLQRTVRSTCQATGKEALLVMYGADTLIDSEVMNRLADPLLHLLRNAVDHGLELPAERIARGKPSQGRIELVFARQGQQVVLQCRDDGHGLDLVAIRQRAVTQGLIAPEQTISDDEAARLILLPGFSTRDAVSEISGRGVGLDVVRDWAHAMSGSVRISTGLGQGTIFELRFAASLSTMHSLVVEVSGQRFALPSLQIERAVPRGVGSFEFVGDQMVFRQDKRSLPACRLADLAGMPGGALRALDELDAVIVRHDEKLMVLAVDRLLDARELLVKAPGRFARHVRGIAGLSILGDGSVAVNLDLAQLLSHAVLPQRLPHASARPVAAALALPALQRGVLIVDDALSVRNSLLQLVQDAGYRAEVARDGMEAIDTLRGFKADLILTDLEMPNMNGIELTAHIRGRDDLKGLPVIMITSRSQDKHRRMAHEAGVDTYITKPYNDGDLLGMIRKALAA